MAQHRLMSYASRDQLDVTGRAPQFLEWDRNYVTVLGVANKRLYEFRLQSSHKAFEAAKVLVLLLLLLVAAKLAAYLILACSAGSFGGYC